MSKFVGIDISKKTFDIAYQKQEKWFFSRCLIIRKVFKS